MAYIRFSKYTRIGQQHYHSRVWYRVSKAEAKEMHTLYPASSAIMLEGDPVESSHVGDSVMPDLEAQPKLPGEVEAAHAKAKAKLEKEAAPKKARVKKGEQKNKETKKKEEESKEG